MLAHNNNLLQGPRFIAWDRTPKKTRPKIFLSIVACLYGVCLVTPFPIALNSFPIVVGTDRKENTAALLLPCIATLFTKSSFQTL
jgi:hypothetical protein